MMYLLMYRNKYSHEEKILAACADKEKVIEVIEGLDGVIGYIPGLGIYSQKAGGYYIWREVEVVDPDKLEGRFQDWLDARKS